MNKRTLFGFLALASAVSAQTPATAPSGVNYYAVPSVVIAFPGDFDRAVGGALAFGATINNVHSIEAEVMSFTTNEYSDDFRFTPLLATYKYNFVLSGKIALTAGASVGVTFEKIDYYVMYGPGSSPGSSGYMSSLSQTAFTSGLVGGASYAVNNRVSFDANAHLLRLEDTDLTTAGNMVLVTLGIKIRF